MATDSPVLRTTTKKAKKAYNKRESHMSERERAIIDRNAELQRRADGIKEREQRKRENARKRAEKEEKQREARRKQGIVEPIDEGYVSPRQVRMDNFFKPSAAIAPKIANANPKLARHDKILDNCQKADVVLKQNEDCNTEPGTEKICNGDANLQISGKNGLPNPHISGVEDEGKEVANRANQLVESLGATACETGTRAMKRKRKELSRASSNISCQSLPVRAPLGRLDANLLVNKKELWTPPSANTVRHRKWCESETFLLKDPFPELPFVKPPSSTAGSPAVSPVLCRKPTWDKSSAGKVAEPLDDVYLLDSDAEDDLQLLCHDFGSSPLAALSEISDEPSLPPVLKAQQELICQDLDPNREMGDKNSAEANFDDIIFEMSALRSSDPIFGAKETMPPPPSSWPPPHGSSQARGAEGAGHTPSVIGRRSQMRQSPVDSCAKHFPQEELFSQHDAGLGGDNILPIAARADSFGNLIEEFSSSQLLALDHPTPADTIARICSNTAEIQAADFVDDFPPTDQFDVSIQEDDASEAAGANNERFPMGDSPSNDSRQVDDIEITIGECKHMRDGSQSRTAPIDESFGFGDFELSSQDIRRLLP